MNLRLSNYKTTVFLSLICSLSSFFYPDLVFATTPNNEQLTSTPAENTYRLMQGCSVRASAANRAGAIAVDLNGANTPTLRANAYQKAVDQMFQSPMMNDPQFKSCFEQRFNQAIGGIDRTAKDEASCKEASNALNTAVNEMLKACSTANMGSGQNACLQQANKCRSCDPNDDDSLDREECDEDDVGTIEAYGGAINNLLMGGQSRPVTPNLQKSMKRFRQCPAMASEDYDKMQDDVKKSKEKTQDLTTQLTELQEDLNQLEVDQQKAENIIQEEMDALEEEIEAKIKEIGEKEKTIRTETEDLAYQIADQINVADEELRSLDISLFDAKIAYDSKVADASSKCHASALEKINQLNTQKQELIHASLYTAGGFNNLMNSTGLSNREKYRRLADSYYRECKNDRAFKENMNLLENTLKSERAKILEKKNAIKKRVAQLKRNLEIAKQRLPGELQKLFQELEAYKKQAEKKFERLMQRLMQERQKFAKQQNTIAQKISQVQSQLQEEQSYLQQKQAFLSLQHTYSGGVATDKGSASEAVSMANVAITKAEAVIDSCNCPCKEDRAGVDSQKVPIDSSACSNAYNNIQSFYGSTAQCTRPTAARRGGSGGGQTR